MNTATLSLTPLMRHGVGFDRFNDLFESALRADNAQTSYPPYNIEKYGDHEYAITMAIAGFGESDLQLVVEGDQLTVSGAIEQTADRDAEVEYLHRGIASRAFERSFRLADHMQVVGAEMQNGMLRIRLERVVPEEAKPRIISITSANTTAEPKKLASHKKKN